jgi:alkylated DNA repair dioxygenase AlkB
MADAWPDDETARRTRSMIHRLKVVLGPEAYAAFRGAARASQLGKVEIAEYYAYVARVLRNHPDLLEDVVATYPEDRTRKRLEGLLREDREEAKRDDARRVGESKAGAPCGSSPSYKAEVLADGLVVLRGALDFDAQTWLVRAAFEAGEANDAEGNRGFYERTKAVSETRPDERDERRADDAAPSVLRLNQGTRGRVILPKDAFPERLTTLCMECVSLARAATDTMPGMNPTTVLVNFYKENAQFKWHRDSEDPLVAGTKSAPPIVSFTVGLSCDFAVKKRFEDETWMTIRLDSGDVLLFGGASRMLVHSVTRVVPRTMPTRLRGEMLHGRLNVTVRDIGRGVIDESQFPAYRVRYGGEMADDQV